MEFHLKTSYAHYDDVIMTMLASQITSLTVVYSIVYSGVNQRKHQSSAALAFVREIHRGPVNFPHKWPVTRKMFPFDDVIMTMLAFVRGNHRRPMDIFYRGLIIRKVFPCRAVIMNHIASIMTSPMYCGLCYLEVTKMIGEITTFICGIPDLIIWSNIEKKRLTHVIDQLIDRSIDKDVQIKCKFLWYSLIIGIKVRKYVCWRPTDRQY